MSVPPVNQPILPPNMPDYLGSIEGDLDSTIRRAQSLEARGGGLVRGGGLQAWFYDDQTQAGSGGQAWGLVKKQEFIGDIDWTNRVLPGFSVDPGGTSTGWTMIARGFIEFPTNENYRFQVTYEDGAEWRIGSTIVVSDYAFGAQRSANAVFTPDNTQGPMIYPCALHYFQSNTTSTNAQRLKFEWRTENPVGTPAGSIPAYQLVPKSVLHYATPLWIPVGTSTAWDASMRSSYTGAWRNLDRQHPARFRKRNGMVELAGNIANGVIGSAAITLPLSYANSPWAEYYPCVSNNAFGAVELNHNVLRPFTGSGIYVALNGISWPAPIPG